MSLQKLRSGVKQFDAQWDGTAPTVPGFSTPVWLIKFDRHTEWWKDSNYFYISQTARNAIDGLFSREQDDFAWVYIVRHTRPKTRKSIIHGEIVCDQERFPVWTLQANRRKESKQILTAVCAAIDSIAWNELDEALQKEFANVVYWDNLVTDVENNPFFDEYGNDEIVGRTFVCSFPVLRELGNTLTYKLLERAESDREDFGETAQYVDEQLEESLEAVAEEYGLHVFVEDNDVFLTKTLLEPGDIVALDTWVEFEWEEYPDGYGHTMASPAEQRVLKFAPGTQATVGKIKDIDEVTVEITHEGATYEETLHFRDLRLYMNHTK